MGASDFQFKDSDAIECKHCKEEFRRKNRFHQGNGFLRDLGAWMRIHSEYCKQKSTANPESKTPQPKD